MTAEEIGAVVLLVLAIIVSFASGWFLTRRVVAWRRRRSDRERRRLRIYGYTAPGRSSAPHSEK